MNINDNMLSEQYQNIEINNKGFLLLDSVFKNNGWHIVKNDMNWISYTKFGDETSFFDIKITPDKIIVSVPLKNSIYQYTTSFKSYYQASEYIEYQFFEFIK